MERISSEAWNVSKYHQVSSATVVEGVLSLVVDGTEVRQDLRTLTPLFRASSDEELSKFEISPSGYGIHWPLLDDDLSIDGLLGIQHEPETLKKSA